MHVFKSFSAVQIYDLSYIHLQVKKYVYVYVDDLATVPSNKKACSSYYCYCHGCIQAPRAMKFSLTLYCRRRNFSANISVQRRRVSENSKVDFRWFVARNSGDCRRWLQHFRKFVELNRGRFVDRLSNIAFKSENIADNLPKKTDYNDYPMSFYHANTRKWLSWRLFTRLLPAGSLRSRSLARVTQRWTFSQGDTSENTTVSPWMGFPKLGGESLLRASR